MNVYVAMFDRKKIELYAESLYEAKLKALEHFKPSKSKQGLVSVHLVEVKGEPVLQPTDF